MVKNQYIASVTILMVAIAGCTAGETPQATNTSSPTQETTPAITQTQPQNTKPTTQTQPFINPLIAASPQPTVASLTLSTNKEERLNIIPTGRPDPFAQIIEPIGAVSVTNPQDTEKVPVLPPLPTVKNPTVIPETLVPKKPVNIETKKPTVKRPANLLTKKPVNIPAQKPLAKPILPKLISPIIPSIAIKPELPPTPQPDGAKAVLVSGVILIGKVPQAIIKIADEPTSRYVQPGQRLVNGVLVKRIEMSDSANPVVVLEQYGIEVAKQVGEKPVNTEKNAKPSTTALANNSSEFGNAQQSVLKVLW